MSIKVGVAMLSICGLVVLGCLVVVPICERRRVLVGRSGVVVARCRGLQGFEWRSGTGSGNKQVYRPSLGAKMVVSVRSSLYYESGNSVSFYCH